MPVRILGDSEIYSSLKSKGFPAQSAYLAMYSSWLGGITTNPVFMQIPIDDHMVHRGDGVFEAIKTYGSKVVLFPEHWARMQRSAQAIGLPLSLGFEEVKEILQDLYAFASGKDVLFRLFLSRGPGGFTTNPYESIGSQFYVVMTAFKAYPEEKYKIGVTGKRSRTPVKPSWLAQAKTCNYLPNVIMRKEAVDAKVDFVVGFDESGFVAESSTENVVVINDDNEIIHPNLDYILHGCTMKKVFDLAPNLGLKPLIKPITEEELKQAKEVLVIGTTLDVVSMTKYEGLSIADGQVGSYSQALRQLLIKTQKESDFDLNLF